MILIDTISTVTGVPLLSIIIQLCYNYNTITYNLIRTHIRRLFIFSLYVFYFK